MSKGMSKKLTLVFAEKIFIYIIYYRNKFLNIFNFKFLYKEISKGFFSGLRYMKNILSRLRPNNNLDDIKSLYKVPERENGDDMPHYQVFKSNLIEQADLLYLPEDKLDNN